MFRKLISLFSRITLLVTLLIMVIFSASAINILYYYNGTPVAENACAVIFGAAVRKDDIPSNALKVRIESAATLYNQGKTNCLILSGGPSTYGAHESDVMKKELLARGVSENDMVLDYNARNTFATLVKLPQEGPYIFVSNNFHLARISLLAQRLDIQEYSLTGADQLGGGYYVDGKLFLHEVIGGVYYFFRGDVWFEV